VYGLGFTCEEIDYLDSKAESEARRSREAGPDSAAPSEARSVPSTRPRKANGRTRKATQPDGQAQQAAL
jgi:single-strand DNA-binding protein